MKAADLEQALRDDPGDLASWRAYGDRLRERGDARGTLIELRQRRDRTRPADREALDREIAALEDEHRRSWDAGLPEGATVLERRYGFATKVAVEWSGNAPASIEQVVQAPFVTALRIAPSDAQERSDLLWDEDPSEPRGRCRPRPSTPAPSRRSTSAGSSNSISRTCASAHPVPRPSPSRRTSASWRPARAAPAPRRGGGEPRSSTCGTAASETPAWQPSRRQRASPVSAACTSSGTCSPPKA
ncbi:hypothetical protein ACFQY7_44605 [Actinomadura luteofluorescens]|uniref:hypothetical protein n=1 Tax=Actinomadura luteofluorescens TaxID=46163 RepID=UPI00363F8F21